jgi:hypothetical protein
MSALDTTATRLHYIDWLRVLAVLLLFPYHVSRVFNEEAFYVKADEVSAALNVVLGFVSVWHMPLLFLLAGASTYFALRRRSSREYLGERFTRLGVPFVIGVFILLIPVQTWYGARFNSGYTGRSGTTSSAATSCSGTSRRAATTSAASGSATCGSSSCCCSSP